MAFKTFYGFGLSGDPIIAGGAMLHGSVVYYVDSDNGNDANSGASPTLAVKTLDSILGAAFTTGMIVVLMPGFSETLTTSRTINESMVIIGAGKLGDKPAAQIGFDSGAQLILAGGAADLIMFRNVRFNPRTDTASSNVRISATGASQRIVFEGCWFECDATSEVNGSLDSNDAQYIRLTDCTFESLAEYNATTQAPAARAAVIDNAAICYMENVRTLGGEGAWGGVGGFAWAITSGNAVYLERMEFTVGGTGSVSGAGWIHTNDTAGMAKTELSNMNWHYAPGKGGVLGPAFITTGRINTTNQTLYVSSVIGDDTYDGTQRQRPYATLGAALTQAGTIPGDTVIILAADHDETLTSALALANEGITIVGEGLDSNGEPTAKIRFNGSGAQLTLNDECYIWNVRFMANQQANSSSRVACPAGDKWMHVRDCVFECDEFDTVAALHILGGGVLGDAQVHIRNTKFVSVATSAATVPATALLVNDKAWGIYMDDVTFDGGTYGFSSHACDLDDVEHVVAVNTRLMNGADMHVLQNQAVAGIILHFADNSESTYVYTEAPGG